MKARNYLGKYLQPETGRILVVIISVIFYVFLFLLSPLLFSFIIDNLLQEIPISDPFTLWWSDLLGGAAYLRENLWIGFLLIILLNVFIAVFNYFNQMFIFCIITITCDHQRITGKFGIFTE